MRPFRFQQFTIHQSHAAMKVGTDSDLLGALSVGGERILDIGTGTGVLALMMAQRCPEARITAVEIDGDAVIDARRNFQESPFADRITLLHTSFQQYLEDFAGTSAQEAPAFDSVVCNPPYFDRSLESPDAGRARARHSSSLPFSVLARGAYRVLQPDGFFSLCFPPEVYDDFTSECLIAGFQLHTIYRIKSVPERPPKRFVLVYRKGRVERAEDLTFCLRNSDRTLSSWYEQLMSDFLLKGGSADPLPAPEHLLERDNYLTT